LWSKGLALPLAIQIHLLSVTVAVLTAVFQLALSKGGSRHRATGYIWAVAMIFAALSSFWISSMPMLGPFGPIHILSVITLIGVPQAVMAARRGNIRAHKLAVLQLVGFALVGAGAFAIFSPGRILNTWFFGVVLW
jgi:uncharacterized membrane protein